jgi:hypothetical protein
MKPLMNLNRLLLAIVTFGLNLSACSASGPANSHGLPPGPPPAVARSSQPNKLEFSPEIDGSYQVASGTVACGGAFFTPNGEVFCGVYGEAQGGGVGWLGYSNLTADGSGNFGTQFRACGSGQGSLWGYDYATNTYSNSLGISIAPCD